MKLMSILSGQGFVMYNKQLAKSVSVNAAIIFGQLCASYESFNGKGMITVKDNKDYFFLTSDTLEEETALTYKQQLKAVKDLEKAGYIETKIMGVPSKKYFFITDKIVQELFNEVNSSSDKREDLESTSNREAVVQKVIPSHDQKENLGMPKGHSKVVQKGSSIKKKNKKEKDKNKEDKIDNYQESIINSHNPQAFKSLLLEATDDFYNHFAIGRWSKNDWNKLMERFVDETIQSGRYENIPLDKIKGYAYVSIKNMADHSDYKKSDKFKEYKDVMEQLSSKGTLRDLPLYMNNCLEEGNEELPY
ncbi:hypothetical protein [Priestia megaterium]|uniref:hypothetical protein n=1 Tax=Priestia megaterium TaxID=1404 RepID=UPI002A69E950|nr:hypothetical protein [Priestia megaterium]MDY0943429.1 hypothetical protein [Priestia megaterium]